MIFWSGIPLLFAQKSSERKETHDHRSKAVFLDAKNFTANFRLVNGTSSIIIPQLTSSD